MCGLSTNANMNHPDQTFSHYVFRGIRQVPLRLLRQALRRQQIHPKRPALMDSQSGTKRDMNDESINGKGDHTNLLFIKSTGDIRLERDFREVYQKMLSWLCKEFFFFLILPKIILQPHSYGLLCWAQSAAPSLLPAWSQRQRWHSHWHDCL